MRLLLASLLATLAGVSPAFADGLFSTTPVVHISAVGENQAQLQKQLQSLGYSHILLSTFEPNLANPQPQLTNPSKNLAQTSVHPGWNGTAEKNGVLFYVYANK